MAKAAIVSFIIDLKITPDGEVKILEFGDIYRSGFTGYERLTGLSPLTAKVFPFYERFGIPVWQGGDLPEGYRYASRLDDQMGIVPVRTDDKAFDSKRLPDHSAIITQPEFSTETTRAAMARTPANRIVATNANGLVNACFEDKVILAAFGDKYAPRLFPPQKLYPIDRGRLDIGQVVKDFAGVKTVVLKTPWDANAQGVDLIDTGRLMHAFNIAAGNLYLKLCKKPVLKGNPACVVQEYIRGKPIIALDDRGVINCYEPTMRVFATAWHDGGETRVKCHDAYYKVPPNPVSDKVNRKNRISKVAENKGPKSAPVPLTDMDRTFDQIEEQLPALFHQLFTVPASDYAREFLQSEDVVLKRVGFRIATEDEYFDRPAGQEDYPRDIARLIVDNRRHFGGMDKIRELAGQKRRPHGLHRSLQEAAGTPDIPSKKPVSLRRLLVAGSLGLAGLTVAELTGIGNGGLQERSAEAIFSSRTKQHQTVSGLSNLRLFSFDPLKVTPALRGQIAEEARKAGYQVCSAGRWDDEASRLYPAFRQAMQNRDATIVKIDFTSSERTEHNGVVIEDQLVTDTVIYGTACNAPKS